MLYKDFEKSLKDLRETIPQSVRPYVSNEAAPIFPIPHNEQMREISPRSAPKEVAAELSTVGETSGDRVSKPGDAEARPRKDKKVTHKELGIEDVDTPEPAPPEEKVRDIARETSSEADSDSEDEAPETVTASAGFNDARTAVLEAAKVAARQEADRKAKRRERDQLLKSQAKASSKHKQPKEKPLPSNPLSKDAQVNASITNPHDDPQPKPKPTSKTPLPTYLPASVLATSSPPLPSVQPPTRPSSTSQKRKFLDADPKPPKDLKRGKLKVRVLQEEKTSLPPKVSKNGRALREAWLMGRRQGGVVPRREAGWKRREFVRK